MKHEWFDDPTNGANYYWHRSICKNCGLLRGISKPKSAFKRIIYWSGYGEFPFAWTSVERSCSEVKMRRALG